MITQPRLLVWSPFHGRVYFVNWIRYRKMTSLTLKDLGFVYTPLLHQYLSWSVWDGRDVPTQMRNSGTWYQETDEHTKLTKVTMQLQLAVWANKYVQNKIRVAKKLFQQLFEENLVQKKLLKWKTQRSCKIHCFPCVNCLLVIIYSLH